MDLADGVRLRQDEKIVVALEVVAVRGKALAAKIGFRQLESLDLGPHGAVEHEDALGCGLAQRGKDFCAIAGANFILGHFALSLSVMPGLGPGIHD